ncbi:conserved hypothetical protein [Bosea sp. 62]|uniref:DUF3991 and toprim domain-containing protein n=1 Tax=unclassified Bosea (in: a-proteobacteria) TaxID=2653178 RepID=UPI001255D611|nr:MULTISPECIES: DUF3991 and toprim domain-containing protein [unclassified Bosea (in: a-proteobacteria)]CAD5270958.1 conserved hypothetical protein [Bosea sp. 21B]CAD5291796.1 conserved hypothetical protein [Bosea sp. 46]CAD5300653.1 conserved hypothetical protein [Bosea sp. 7B]VVT60756.1 conserved hypothetical protein [Bosea sp. EC-HK365B]VXC05116.1 conserved hypothetical protein [Bosea sp. 62]
MEQRELEELKRRVLCAAVLEKAGFAIDLKESTRRAVKHRRGSDIIIVIHEGRGWFDPLSDAKGDVFSLIQHLDGVAFTEVLVRAAGMVGFRPAELAWQTPRAQRPDVSLAERWRARRALRPGSPTWRYLRHERHLPESVLRAAIRQARLREGPHGSVWAAHVDDGGTVSGWEERGPQWRGFSTGGAKMLFRLGAHDALRLCITEAAIDAMSLAALEGLRDGSLYLSTGGGWSPATDTAVRTLAARPGAQLVAATDANSQGEAFAGRLREIAETTDCDWIRLTPPADDWNDALKEKAGAERERRNGRRHLPHARRPHQG